MRSFALASLNRNAYQSEDLYHATNERLAFSITPNMEGENRKFGDDGGGQDPRNVKAKWRDLFNFTSKAHNLSLFLGIFLSILSGIIVPAFALFLGKIFDSFTKFGAGSLDGSPLLVNISQYAIYLVALGLASWLLNGMYFAFWLVFGELQARSGRDKLFSGILQKDMQWFDTRNAGIAAFIIRLQA